MNPAETSDHTMSKRSIAGLYLLVLTMALPAVEVPLDQLGERAVVTDLGTVELQAWFARDGFPDLDRSSALEAKPDAENAKRWQTPGGGATLSISDGTLEFGLRGRNNYAELFNWFPTVTFTPTSPGTYALAGTLALNGGGKGDGIIAWAVFRLLPTADEAPEVAPVLHQRLGRAATIDLASLPELRAIKVAPGEMLMLSVWRPAWHDWGNGRLRGFTITRLP